jgi:hypothetical protein
MAHNKHKNFITYSARGSETTTSIKEAPLSIQNLWLAGSKIGASIIRVRSRKERAGVTSGDTFTGYHVGRTSVYIPKKTPKPNRQLSFKAKLGIGRTNPTMQILEMPVSCDIQPSFEAVRDADESNRLIRAIFGGLNRRI